MKAGAVSRTASAVRNPLSPLYDAGCRALILGTMPSPASRERGFYYGHPRNRFWPALAAVFEEALPVTNAEKAALALRHGIALWDVLASCEITGAEDASIRKPAANDIAGLVKSTCIKTIYTTGQKAHALYRLLCEEAAGIRATALPSPSPANQRVSMERLTAIYRQHLRGALKKEFVL